MPVPGARYRLQEKAPVVVGVALVAAMSLSLAWQTADWIRLLRAPAPKRDRAGVSQLLSAIDQSVQRLRSAGFGADSARQEDEKEIILTIRIPKQADKCKF